MLLIVTISSDSMMYDSIKRKQKLSSNTQTELPVMKKKVLLCFAENDEMNIYKVAKLCGIGYSTAHSSIKSLEKEGFVQLKSEKINEKGVTAKEYGLTTKGVHRCLCAKLSWHEKVVIVEKQQSLLKPNVLEGMKFIEALNDSHIEELVSSNISICKLECWSIP